MKKRGDGGLWRRKWCNARAEYLLDQADSVYSPAGFVAHLADEDLLEYACLLRELYTLRELQKSLREDAGWLARIYAGAAAEGLV